MLTTILLVLAALVAVFLLVAALQPSRFRVERGVVVSAPALRVFAQFNDLRRWQEISPYVKLDPAAVYAFEGPPAGPGAALAWEGNGQAGAGRLAIVESKAPDFIRMTLVMHRPFACANTVEFAIRSDGRHTSVTWSLSGDNKLLAKAMGLVMNMDKMIGRDFEVGLQNLKTLVEAESASR